jgi:hypothetical protein
MIVGRLQPAPSGRQLDAHAVPGPVGGSETYTRALCRALGRVGELEYDAFVTTIAPDAGDGLPITVVHEYRAGRTMPLAPP